MEDRHISILVVGALVGALTGLVFRRLTARLPTTVCRCFEVEGVGFVRAPRVVPGVFGLVDVPPTKRVLEAVGVVICRNILARDGGEKAHGTDPKTYC